VTIRILEAWPWVAALQNQQLLPEAKIICDQQRLWSDRRRNRPQQTAKHSRPPPRCWTSRRLTLFNVINEMGLSDTNFAPFRGLAQADRTR
jgi:hypothetical protein